jgi:hypothetical protein
MNSTTFKALIRMNSLLRSINDFLVSFVIKRIRSISTRSILMNLVRITAITLITSLLSNTSTAEIQRNFLVKASKAIPFVRLINLLRTVFNNVDSLLPAAQSILSASVYVAVGVTAVYGLYKVGSYVSGTSIYSWFFSKSMSAEEVHAKNVEMHDRLSRRLDQSHNSMISQRTSIEVLTFDYTKQSLNKLATKVMF